MKKLLLILPLFLIGCSAKVLDEVSVGKLVSAENRNSPLSGFICYNLVSNGGVPYERCLNSNYADIRHYNDLVKFLNKNVKITTHCIIGEKCTMKIEELKWKNYYVY